MPPRQNTDQGAQPETISRRVFIESAIAATAVAAGAAEASRVLRRAEGQGLPADGHERLTRGKLDQLSLVLNRIIPVASGSPAAGDLGVAVFIDDVIAEAPQLRAPVADLLGRLETLNAFASGTTEAQRDQLLKQVEQERREEFDLLVRLTYVGYYSDPRVRTAIGWEKPAPAGVFDSRLLENVKRRHSNGYYS